MLRPGKFALILGMASVMAALPTLTLAQTSQKESEAAGVAAAIRFQRAEDAAAAREARIDAARGGESNSADRMAPQTTAKVAPKEPQAGGVAAAIRFQQAEQVAADRQARIDARAAGESSADRMAPAPKSRTKTARTTSATARPRDSQ